MLFTFPKWRNNRNIFSAILAVILIISAGIVGYFWWRNKQTTDSTKPLTWEECIKIPGARQLLTYPGQCVAPDGRKVIQPISEEEKKKLEQERQQAGECVLCGPQGIHNVYGNTCVQGLVCQRGETTSLSYCVKPGESVRKCESNNP